MKPLTFILNWFFLNNPDLLLDKLINNILNPISIIIFRNINGLSYLCPVIKTQEIVIL